MDFSRSGFKLIRTLQGKNHFLISTSLKILAPVCLDLQQQRKEIWKKDSRKTCERSVFFDKVYMNKQNEISLEARLFK
jgi:hypothetical protein